MNSIIRFIKNWALPISMLVGVVSYFVYVNIHALDHTHQLMNDIISVVQPGLIFMMLFFAFCKVEPKALRPHGWQLKLIGIQTIAFILLATPIILFPTISGRVIIESAMICMICPTATAASVVATKLHGNTSCVVSYTFSSLQLYRSFIAEPTTWTSGRRSPSSSDVCSLSSYYRCCSHSVSVICYQNFINIWQVSATSHSICGLFL